MVTVGAFHLTEIPEIFLENQMEHVNFSNAVSKSSDDLSRLSTNWKFRKFRNFDIPLKHFPTTLLLFSLRRAKTATKTKMVGSRPFQCLDSGFISPNAERRDLSDSVKFFKIKETAFQKLTCSIWFSSKISGISVKWKAPNKPPIIYKVCHAVAFHFATVHSWNANWGFCSNGKRAHCISHKEVIISRTEWNINNVN